MIKRLIKLFVSKQKLFELFTYQVKSQKNAEQIAKSVQEACDTYQFALLHNYVYHEVVASKGFPIEKKVFIFEVCQAKVAAMVLSEETQLAPFMPCRIAIYEDAGQSVISTQNMEMILNTLNKKSDLYKETSTLFNTLKSLMNSLK